MSSELLIIAALAVYRLTLMINAEDGPADIFGRLRSRIGIKYDEHSLQYSDNWLGQGILCYFCLSVWLSFGVTALLVIFALLNRLDLAQWLLLPFALSGGAILLRNHDPSNSRH